MTNLDQLARIAADTAMRACAEYLRQKRTAVNVDHLLPILRRYTKDAVEPALNDASAALEARMDKVAEATFLASMRLAGINAAKIYAEEL